MKTRRSEDKNARYKPQILDVCTRLAKRVKEVMDAGEFPLVPGGDHGTLVPGGVSFREAHLLMEYVADSGALQSNLPTSLVAFEPEKNCSSKYSRYKV